MSDLVDILKPTWAAKADGRMECTIVSQVQGTNKCRSASCVVHPSDYTDGARRQWHENRLRESLMQTYATEAQPRDPH